MALVESPAQLLNTLEWVAAGAGRSTDLSILVLAPRDGLARAQLRRLSTLATTDDLAVSWYETRLARRDRPGLVATVLRQLRRASLVVLGDPFSRMIQTLMIGTGPRSVVLVDDGSATFHFLDCWQRDAALVRWHHANPGHGDRMLGRAFGRLLGRGEVSLFTAMPVDRSVLRVESNEYRWTRARWPAPRVSPGGDLVGTSLVETGVVGLQHYLAAVGELTATHDLMRYWAHRRESADKLGRIEQAGLQIVRPDLPMELAARRGPIGARVVTFPSTLVHTLPQVLADTAVEMTVIDVPDRWLVVTDAADRSAFLARVSGRDRSGPEGS